MCGMATGLRRAPCRSAWEPPTSSLKPPRRRARSSRAVLGILETRTQAARQPPTSRGPAGASRVGTEGDRWWITVRGPGCEGGSRAECATWAPACDHRAALRLGRRGGRGVQVLQGEMAEPTWVVPCWTSEGPGAGCTVSLCFKVDSVTRVSLGLTLLCTASGPESTPGSRTKEGRGRRRRRVWLQARRATASPSVALPLGSLLRATPAAQRR